MHKCRFPCYDTPEHMLPYAQDMHGVDPPLRLPTTGDSPQSPPKANLSSIATARPLGIGHTRPPSSKPHPPLNPVPPPPIVHGGG